MLGRSPLHHDSLSWYHGAKGDMAVGAALAKLPPDWTVFHSLPVGQVRAEIGHLVVGPGGVFTITMRNPRGKNVWVFKRLVVMQGRRVPYLRDAEFEAERVTRVLRKRMPQHGAVQPVIALVDPREVVIREKPAAVKVIDAKHLNSWLLRLPPLLNPRELMEIMTLVDDPVTWGAQPQVDPGNVMARFAELDSDVRVSRRRRRTWISWGSAVLVVTIAVEIVVVVQVITALLADLGIG
nr:nuclease-related domain-containing protein [Cryobacterium roopkundense]